jgi:uncharacterized protein YjiS (DUF1127 family)
MTNSTQSIPDRTLDEVAAAEFLDVAVRTMQAWRQQRRGPRYLSYSSRCVKYKLSDLVKFQESRAVETAERAAG